MINFISNQIYTDKTCNFDFYENQWLARTLLTQDDRSVFFLCLRENWKHFHNFGLFNMGNGLIYYDTFAIDI